MFIPLLSHDYPINKPSPFRREDPGLLAKGFEVASRV